MNMDNLYIDIKEISNLLKCSLQYARRLCSGRFYNLNGIKRYYPATFRNVIVKRNKYNRPKLYVNKFEVIKFMESRKNV
jgi:hypothetical protein